jgi:hypothetical protein
MQRPKPLGQRFTAGYDATGQRVRRLDAPGLATTFICAANCLTCQRNGDRDKHEEITFSLCHKCRLAGLYTNEITRPNNQR